MKAECDGRTARDGVIVPEFAQPRADVVLLKGETRTMPTPQQPSLIVRQKSPQNIEFPFASLSDWLIPTELFFVRNHFPSPDLDARDWRLRVGGAVERPIELDLDSIKAMRSTTFTAVVECAGNGRVYYEPPKEGLQWQNGAVGNAAWTGVLLREILEMAGVKRTAREVLLAGADSGVVDTNKKTASPGPIAFARSLPLEKAIADSTILAYSMNEEPLTRDHGYPLRAVVGGWFGMAWVKWITDITVVEQPFLGYWQARDYFRWERSLGEPRLVPLAEMEVKAQIARPVQGARLIAGQPYRIFGAAWSGEAVIRQVQVCTGDGRGWREGRLLETERPFAWRLWEYMWTPEEVGQYILRCRAIDGAGCVQPELQRSDCESYAANWIVPVEVTVVPEPQTYEEEFVI
ncbi:sulfite oxidase [Rhizobium ruizarguesonis]|uniref:Molybdopterin-dependent oxidoreductase n=2 Tax=Rhizobium ruizarguesonis TaxID=2081791 RepID=A0AAE4YU76_9HYPH|nr:sulfite oxidase [Rhizobium leguminosarum]NEH39587.1 molybdopterin-dependent oxidoreductase [Rhizobium ruizarguesonis]NKL12014.1 molybdopterin-dependent oxidoreductase [Rhizobium leguminosarum bv. viciae]QIO48678.1 sulfite oxidase [Rhizobium leguminosarum bv. trifolii]MBY5852060.1 sulfite oxidase [Rhizobium leguminosarum]